MAHTSEEQLSHLSQGFAEELSIPAGLNYGAVVGKGASNIKWIFKTAGGVKLDIRHGVVTIHARDATTLARAKELLQDQFMAAVAYGTCAFPHPKRVDCVLMGPFGTPPIVTLELRKDGVAAATRCADELYQLVPFGHQDTNAGVDAAGRALCSLAIGETEAEATRNPSTSAPRHPGHRQHVVNVHEVNHFSYDAAGAKQVAEALTNSVHVAAAAAAASVTAAAAADTAAAAVDASADATGGVDRVPRDEGGSCEGRCGTTLKLRFNLGKQLCYKLPPELWEEATRHGLDLQGLQAANSKHKSVFSNVVTASQYDTVRGWLRDQKGFRLEGSKETASIGVLNRRLNIKYNVTLDLSSSPATVIKVRLPPQRCYFVTFMAGPHQPDLRLKLLATGRDMRDDPTAGHVAEQLAAHVSAHGFASAVAPGAVGAVLGRDMELDQAVRKSKEVHVGEITAADGSTHSLKLTLTQIETAAGRRQHRVSGTLPAADRELRSLLRRHCAMAGAVAADEAEASESSQAAGPSKAEGEGPEGSRESGEGASGGVRDAAVGGRCSEAWADGLVRAVCAFAEQLGEAMGVRDA